MAASPEQPSPKAAEHDGAEHDDAARDAPAVERTDAARIATRLASSAAERERTLGELAATDVHMLAAVVDASVATLLVAPLGSPDRTEQRRTAEALAPLSARAPALATELERALSSASPRMRWGAAFTLGRAHAHPPARLWPAVRETMSLDDGDQRWAASELACRLARDHAAVLDELRSAIDDPSAVVRKMALYCLRDVRPPDLADVACRALDDADPGVRLAAIAAAAEAPGDRDASAPGAVAVALAIAARVGDDASPGVRRAAAAALGRLGVASPSAIAALELASASTDASLARAARDALAKLTAVTP